MDELFDSEEPNVIEINSLEEDEEPGDRKATAEMATDVGIDVGILPEFTVERSRSIYMWVRCRTQAGHWHLGRWSRGVYTWRYH